MWTSRLPAQAESLIHRLRSRLKKVNWLRYCSQFARKYGWSYKKDELKILVKFLMAIEKKLKNRFWFDSSAFNGINHLSGRRWFVARSDDLFYTACHEAGHLVSHWFSDCPTSILSVTIISGKEYSDRLGYEEDFAKTADNLFSYMCVYIGGEINSRRLGTAKKFSLEGMRADLILLSRCTYDLAKMTLEEAIGKDLIQLMCSYFWKCYQTTIDLLKNHQKEAKEIAYALFVEKELLHEEVLNILGPRPQLQKSLYEDIREEAQQPSPEVVRRGKFAPLRKLLRKSTDRDNYAITDFSSCIIDFSDFSFFWDDFGLSLLFNEEDFFGSSHLDPTSSTLPEEKRSTE